MVEKINFKYVLTELDLWEIDGKMQHDQGNFVFFYRNNTR